MPDPALATLSTLPTAALSARLSALASEERSLQLDFLRYLDELDRRRGYVELGYPSLWDFAFGRFTCARAPPSGASPP